MKINYKKYMILLIYLIFYKHLTDLQPQNTNP